jgi:hypothetical protein
MRQYIVIRHEDSVAGTRERPEVGVFTQAHSGRPPVPWDQISIGERVWMKWSGGPIVARARVEGFRQVAACTPERLRQLVAGYRLERLHNCFESLPPVFFGMAVYLADEECLDEPLAPAARTRGESWVVLKTAALEAAWLTAAAPTAADGEHARRSERGSRTVGKALRFTVLPRDEFRCVYCGRRPPEVTLQVDHLHPWSGGGATVLDNLRTSCADCNLGKGARAC